MHRYIKLSFIFIFLLSISTTAQSEIINKIEISGNERISNETITMFSNVNINDDLDSNEINAILKKLYDTNFFKNVSVSLQSNNLIKMNCLIKRINIIS